MPNVYHADDEFLLPTQQDKNPLWCSAVSRKDKNTLKINKHTTSKKYDEINTLYDR